MRAHTIYDLYAVRYGTAGRTRTHRISRAWHMLVSFPDTDAAGITPCVYCVDPESFWWPNYLPQMLLALHFIYTV